MLDAGPLWITEFMAANKGVLADDDNAYSDWIEIHNPTEAPVSLDGWYLTDDSDELTKWQFPAVSIDAGGYLTVFASDKDRTDPAATLHTNFKLTSDGEYLALVRPDGVTISHDYDTFPPLADNVSFGLPGRPDDLTYHVPTSADAGLGLGWTAGGYDDSAWSGASSSSVHITEIGTGTPDYIEIQNLAGTAVDTSGWTLAMKRSYSTPINDPGIVEVALPSVMYPGQILFRNNLANNWRFDLAHRDTQLDLATSWYAVMSGWALVLDDQGVVVDLVAWGYTEAELAMLDVTINGFQVTADTAWLGAPVPSSTSGTPILSRVGTSDHDDAGDFVWEAPSYAWWSSSSVTTGSIGAPNPDLAGAFATTDTSLGFTPYSVGRDTRIQTDLSVAMQDVNSSIWMRREF
ncbi:MAG: lamin tail domain-containing protein, partial [Pirellulaceae bacterium]|nr:lamin tail domain-containing protein [Pirellulaceae bacterium]